MISNQSTYRAGAFSLVELLCVMAIIAILAALILPTLEQGKSRVKRIECENNLHQLGVAFQVFTHDHNDKFPMAVPLAEGGSMEFVQNGYAVGGEFYFAYRHFQALSNELSSPAILICPADRRLPATNFPALQNSNVSYFIGVKAEYHKPNSVLAGDRNLTANTVLNPSILQGGADNRLSWTWELHRYKGNVLFADGRVEEWNDGALAAGAGEQLAGSDLFLPSVIPEASLPVTGYGGNGHFPGSGSGNGMSPSLSSGDRPEYNPPAIPAASSQTRPRPSIVVPAGPQNPPVPAATNPPSTNRFSTNAPATETVAPEETEPTMTPFDQRLAKALRRIIIGTYLLVLLLFLLLLAIKLWRKSQRQKEQRKSAL